MLAAARVTRCKSAAGDRKTCADGAYRPLPGDASHLLIPNSQQINLESPAAAENVLPCIFEAARLQQQLLVAFQI